MSFLKDAKTTAIALAAFSILLGLLFILFPAASAAIVCYVLVAIFIIGGLRMLIVYFRSRTLSYFPTGLLSGLVLLAVALVLLLEAGRVAALLPAIFGAVIVISGVINLCHAFELKRFGWRRWPIMLGLSLAGFLFGLLMLINPFKVASTVMILLGVGLLYSGAAGLFAVAVIAKRIGA